MNAQHTNIVHQQFTVYPGIEYIKEVFEDEQDGRQSAYVLRICREANVRIDTVMNPDGSFALQKPTVSAKACRNTNETLIGVVNADFFNMTNGIPWGAVVMNGSVIKEEMPDNTHFFGIYRDGTPVIGDKATFLKSKQDLKMAVGGRDILVDGEHVPEPVIMTEPARHPRTAVCICENGDLMLVALEGRNPGIAEGLHLQRFGMYLKALGAKQALNLDGGGSTIMAIRMPGQQDIETVNTPSDGFERVCANGIAIFAKQKGNGVCQGAFVTPQQEYVAPGTCLTMSALGLDNLLDPCALPENIRFSIPDDSECAVSEDGIFLAAQTDCDVTVAVSTDERFLGSALLHVRTPDSLHLPASSIYAENATHELSVTATWKGREVLTNTTSYRFKQLDDIGRFDEQGFFHAKQEACEGDVLVSAKNNGPAIAVHVRVGRLPQQITPEDIVTAGCSICRDRPLSFSPRSGERVYLLELQQPEAELQFDALIHKKPKAVGIWVHSIEGALPTFALTAHNETEKLQPSLFECVKPYDSVWTYMEAFVVSGDVLQQVMKISLAMKGEKGARFAIDSFCLVYDYADDDTPSPEIKRVSIKKYAQSGDKERIKITAYFGVGDLKPCYAPIDYKRLRIFVDAAEYTGMPGHYGVNKGAASLMLHNIFVSKGIHRVSVCAQAYGGKQTWENITFDTEQLEIIR